MLVEGAGLDGKIRYISEGDSELGERSSGVLLVDSILQERWMGEGDGGAGGEMALSGSEVGDWVWLMICEIGQWSGSGPWR